MSIEKYQKYKVTISKDGKTDDVYLYGKEEEHVMKIVAGTFKGYVIDKIEPLGYFIDASVYNHTGK